MSDPNFHISTPRLYISYLIPTNPTHCSFLVALYNSDLFIASEGITSIQTDAQAQEQLKNYVELNRKYGYGQYLVSLKSTDLDASFASSTPIGSVSLMRGEKNTAPDIGAALLPEYTGKGYATEAARRLMDYAREELGVKEVFGFSDPRNAPSRKLLERLGLEDRGVVRLKMFGNRPSQVFATKGMRGLEEYGIEWEAV